jgi:FkbH-like protein
MLSKGLIEHVFNHHDDLELVDVLQNLVLKNGSHFALDVAEDLDNILEFKIEHSEHPLSVWVISLAHSQYPLARFLYARYLVRQGSEMFSEAVETLESVVESLPKANSFLLLHLVRLLLRMDRISDATKYLKRALSFSPSYSFFIKCEKIIHKLSVSGKFKFRHSVRIALLGSSTTSFLVPVLQACFFKAGIQVNVYEGAYGSFRQEILDPGSGLYAFKPEAVVILLNHRDLALAPVTNSDMPQKFVEDLRDLWAVLQSKIPCHLLQVGFDIPPYNAWGALDDTRSGGRARTVHKINTLMSENLPSGVSFCDINRIALRCGDSFHSDIDWYQNRQYPSLEALPLLADHLVAHLRAAFGYSSKVLVLDLDNTLWGGVIGEDGLSGINLGPPSPVGEGYLGLQNYIKELKERGVLLAVCSKNNREDAELPFKEHDSMILSLDDFIVFTANWQDKASNIRAIAKELSLGLDSFVFLDDNPVERSWVHSELHDVIVPDCGNTPWEMIATLRQGMYFESLALTEEDIGRHENYKSNLERKSYGEKHATVETFLAGLEMMAESGPVDDMTLSRVTQLINKTNQFNLTTRRYTEEQVRLIFESPDWWTRWFRLEDKFGDHGLIGVMLAEKQGETWCIDSWLMSCRVLGRKLEDFMASELFSAARAEGAKSIVGEYVPSVKNNLVTNMYSDLGFQSCETQNHFILHLAETDVYQCGFICSSEASLLK